jgi:hypothetical protein
MLGQLHLKKEEEEENLDFSSFIFHLPSAFYSSSQRRPLSLGLAMLAAKIPSRVFCP